MWAKDTTKIQLLRKKQFGWEIKNDYMPHWCISPTYPCLSVSVMFHQQPDKPDLLCPHLSLCHVFAVQLSVEITCKSFKKMCPGDMFERGHFKSNNKHLTISQSKKTCWCTFMVLYQGLLVTYLKSKLCFIFFFS